MLIAGVVKAWRNIWEQKSAAVSGIVTTSISLVILGSVILLYLNLTALTHLLFQQANYSVFVGVETDDVVLDRIVNELSSIPNIQDIHLTKAEEVREDLIESFGETGTILRKIELPPFPDVIEFKLDRQSILTSKEIERIRTIDGVDDIVSGRETKEQIETFFIISEFIGLFLISMMVVSIVLMIHNSIQLAVRIRIKEIEILRILGATSAYIRIPFIVEGIMIAVAGSSISLGVIYFLYTFAVAGITFNEATYGIAEVARFFSLQQIMFIFASIVLLGFISSVIATRKILRELNA